MSAVCQVSSAWAMSVMVGAVRRRLPAQRRGTRVQPSRSIAWRYKIFASPSYPTQRMGACASPLRRLAALECLSRREFTRAAPISALSLRGSEELVAPAETSHVLLRRPKETSRLAYAGRQASSVSQRGLGKKLIFKLRWWSGRFHWPWNHRRQTSVVQGAR